jgi:hypothetical protein
MERDDDALCEALEKLFGLYPLTLAVRLFLKVALPPYSF